MSSWKTVGFADVSVILLLFRLLPHISWVLFYKKSLNINRNYVM